MKNSLRMSEEL